MIRLLSESIYILLEDGSRDIESKGGFGDFIVQEDFHNSSEVLSALFKNRGSVVVDGNAGDELGEILSGDVGLVEHIHNGVDSSVEESGELSGHL